MNLGRVSKKEISPRGKPALSDENRDTAPLKHPKGILVGLVVSQIERQTPPGRKSPQDFLNGFPFVKTNVRSNFQNHLAGCCLPAPLPGSKFFLYHVRDLQGEFPGHVSIMDRQNGPFLLKKNSRQVFQSFLHIPGDFFELLMFWQMATDVLGLPPGFSISNP